MSEESGSKQQSQNDEEFNKMSVEEKLKALDTMWWNQDPGEGRCGCCGKYGDLHVSDSGLYCRNC
jgi:hypothetical protein